MKIEKNNYLKKIPKVDYIYELAQNKNEFKDIYRKILIRSIRKVLEELRILIITDISKVDKDLFDETNILDKILKSSISAMKPNLVKVINATGVIIHTNLGRSLFSSKIIENLNIIASNYSNLEFDLKTGKRGSRYKCIEQIICDLTGAESAIVVNNNAAAVLLCLNSLSKGKEAVISRSELVEIGGSFRIPDVMETSGAIMREVGTTNRTHLKDYELAVNEQTGILLKVHQSNFGIIGFTSSVNLIDIVKLGQKYKIPVMKDAGSGYLIDLSKYGLTKEQTVSGIIKTGVDIVTFSGDKLIGGPQAGIIIGKKKYIEKIKYNPLHRALRIDKLTLAALEATLMLYQDENQALKHIPTLTMITESSESIESKAQICIDFIENLNCNNLTYSKLYLSSRVGGGSLPVEKLKTCCVGLKIHGMSVNKIYNHFKNQKIPIIGRIENDLFIMDFRTVKQNEILIICETIKKIV